MRSGWLTPRRLIVVAVVVWVVWSGFELGRAAVSALDGRHAADRVRSEANASDLVAGRALPDLRAAAADFGHARSAVEDPLLAPWRVLPFAGRQLRALGALSANARTMAEVGITGLEQGRGILGSHPQGQARVVALRQLSVISGRAYAGLAHLGAVPDHLVGPLARSKTKLDDDLARLRTALLRGRDGAAAVAALLQGPHTYLLLAANNAEMRAGSGMFLSAGTVTTSEGHLTISSVGPSADLNLSQGAVPLTGDLAARWGWAGPNRDWRNLALSPRFDANAALAAQMWHAATGGSVDGVMAVDAVALRDLLAAVGAVSVNDRTISAVDALSFVLHDQYTGLSLDSPSAGRRDQLGALAGAALQAAQSRSVSNSSLAEQLAKAVGGRHILLWSSDPAAEKAWLELDAGGTVGPDDVLTAVLNQGGNKLDQFLRVSVTATTKTAGRRTTWHLVARLSEVAPSAGEASYVVGPYPGSGKAAGEYTGLIAFSLPWSSTQVKVTGAGPLAAAGPDGDSQVWAVPIDVPTGTSLTVAVDFTLPTTHGAIEVLPSARVPPEQWSALGQSFDDSAPHLLSW